MARMTPGKLAKHHAWYSAQAERFRSLGFIDRADQYERSAATCAETLKSSGHCLICGRSLSDPESVERGIGPDCWEQVA